MTSPVAQANPGASTGAATVAQVVCGTVEPWLDWPLRRLLARMVGVWIPPGLTAGPPYRVLCMHDGQWLLDPDPHTAHNETDWSKRLAQALTFIGPGGAGA
ncbi:MAG: hypothetical protein FJY26_07660 [Betaproteobacteria bacterium]|nr:hypothetical protein [Betaproteobacteria bacterium]